MPNISLPLVSCFPFLIFIPGAFTNIRLVSILDRYHRHCCIVFYLVIGIRNYGVRRAIDELLCSPHNKTCRKDKWS